MRTIKRERIKRRKIIVKQTCKKSLEFPCTSGNVRREEGSEFLLLSPVLWDPEASQSPSIYRRDGQAQGKDQRVLPVLTALVHLRLSFVHSDVIQIT